MKDITFIIPVHDEITIGMLQNALNNINSLENVDGCNIMTLVVKPTTLQIPEDVKCDANTTIIDNDGATDYCSQINFAAKHVNTEYFAILEVDDTYNKKWVKMWNEYLDTHENVSVFLPITVVHRANSKEYEFVNDIVWASSFSSELGFIDFECLQNCASFNLTGGVFKTSDWLGYKPSIKVAFNYEYLLRATNNNQLVYVVPKEGYHHELFREGSLIEQYVKEISEDETAKWFELAKREYTYEEDRNKTITSDKAEDEMK